MKLIYLISRVFFGVDFLIFWHTVTLFFPFLGPWTKCSATCGGGTQTRSVMCKLQSTLEVVADGLCDANEKPPDNEICNDDPCEVSLIF